MRAFALQRLKKYCLRGNLAFGRENSVLNERERWRHAERERERGRERMKRERESGREERERQAERDKMKERERERERRKDNDCIKSMTVSKEMKERTKLKYKRNSQNAWA